MKNYFLLVVILCISISQNSPSQSGRIKKKRKVAKKALSVSNQKSKKGSQYVDYVNKNTKTDKGLFSVHELNNKCYYEIRRLYNVYSDTRRKYL